MNQFSSTGNQYDLSLDSIDSASPSFQQKYSLSDSSAAAGMPSNQQISLQQIQQLQSSSANSTLPNTPGASDDSSPSISTSLNQNNINSMSFFAKNMNQQSSSPGDNSSSMFSDSALTAAMMDMQDFDLVFSSNSQDKKAPQSVTFQDSNGQSDGSSQPFGYQFKASSEVESSLAEFQSSALYPTSSKPKHAHQKSYNSTPAHSSSFQRLSSIPHSHSAGVSPIPSGLEVLESSHAKHHNRHMRIKPHVEHAEVSKKSSHIGSHQHHTNLSGFAALSPQSSASTPSAKPSAIGFYTANSKSSPNYPCPEEWAPLPLGYYSNVPDYYPPIPLPSSSGTSSVSAKSSGATTRLDGSDLEFYLESLTIYPRLLYEISTEHGANLFSRKMSWSLFERSGKVYHELLSGRRLRNTFLHRISRYENRKNACKDGLGAKKGSKNEKGSGYRTYSPKIDRLLGQILQLQNHLRECKLSYYEQKHKSESNRKIKRELPGTVSSSPVTIERKESQGQTQAQNQTQNQNSDNMSSTGAFSFPGTPQSQSLFSSSDNDNGNSASTYVNESGNMFSGSGSGPGSGNESYTMSNSPFQNTKAQATSSITEATSYLTLATEKDTNSQDLPMPQEVYGDKKSNNEVPKSRDEFTNLSTLDNIRVDINPAALSMAFEKASASLVQPSMLQSNSVSKPTQQIDQKSANGTFEFDFTSSNSQNNMFYPSTNSTLQPSNNSDNYSQLRQEMEAQIQKAVEDALSKMKESEKNEAREREEKYNTRLNEVSQRLFAIEQSVNELKLIVQSICNYNNNTNDGAKTPYNVFDGNFLDNDTKDFSNFNCQDSTTRQLNSDNSKSPIGGGGTIDDDEIDRILQKEQERRQQQETQKRTQGGGNRQENELGQEKSDSEKPAVDSKYLFSQQQKLPSIQENQNEQKQHVKLTSSSLSSSPGLYPGGGVLNGKSFYNSDLANMSPLQQKLPSVQRRISNMSLRNSPSVTRRSSLSMPKGSPGPNLFQVNTLLTPTNSNSCFNPLSATTSNTSENNYNLNDLSNNKVNTTGNISINNNNSSSLDTSDNNILNLALSDNDQKSIDTFINPVSSPSQNTNFGLNFMGYFMGDDEDFVREIEGSEDDEDGEPDISECL